MSFVLPPTRFIHGHNGFAFFTITDAISILNIVVVPRKLEARSGTLTRSGNAIMITCHETRSQISNYDRALRTLQQKLDAAEAYKEEEKLEFGDWLKTVKTEEEIQE
ncbi:hypothetical protein FOL47_000540 [Perkinsus chesapeaki]|uniref:Uncharacterized protein n=1 Tax=Perkinsus chesapeaki TaxID=330153 RepID=A0A7J6N154_PERCH|nr:hypothetical protein FOL47_000540 [Perkinsus chesapeaki]